MGYERTPEIDCAHWKWMDEQYGTTTDSPLHHNNRCEAMNHDQQPAQWPVAIVKRRSEYNGR